MSRCQWVDDHGNTCGVALRKSNKSGYCAKHHHVSRRMQTPPRICGADGCNAGLWGGNKSGFCVLHRKYGTKRKAQQKKRIADRKIARRIAAGNVKCKGIDRNGHPCQQYILGNNTIGYCYAHRDQSLVRQEWSRIYGRMWNKTEKGVAKKIRHLASQSDLDACIAESQSDRDGNPVCVYSGRSLILGSSDWQSKPVCDHLDPSLKATDQDGLHNWVLCALPVNSSKKDRCLYEWHENRSEVLGLRSLGSIILDLRKMGKRIPPMPKKSYARNSL